MLFASAQSRFQRHAKVANSGVIEPQPTQIGARTSDIICANYAIGG
jgi:hypothetical protein